MLKLIDSTTYMGRAEQEITFSADFERFVRRGFDLQAIKAVDILEIQKKYNIKGFTFGNYVTQEERYFFLYVLSKQLEALAAIAKTNDLGHGVLKIGFGADGSPGSAAHFQPAHNFINLNRGRKTTFKSYLQGQQTFTHEYLHYLDFKQGRADLNIAHNAASETIKDSTPAKSLKTRLFAEFIRELYENDEFKAEINKLKPFTMDYWFSPVEIAARAFEAAIQTHVHANLPAFKKYFIKDYTSPVYPSNALIKKYDLVNQAVKILRGESWSKAQEPAPQEPKQKKERPFANYLLKVEELETNLIKSKGAAARKIAKQIIDLHTNAYYNLEAFGIPGSVKAEVLFESEIERISKLRGESEIKAPEPAPQEPAKEIIKKPLINFFKVKGKYEIYRTYAQELADILGLKTTEKAVLFINVKVLRLTEAEFKQYKPTILKHYDKIEIEEEEQEPAKESNVLKSDIPEVQAVYLSVGAIPYEVAKMAHYGTSFDYEKRAKSEQSGFIKDLEEAYNKTVAKAPADKRDEVLNLFKDFAPRYKAKYMAYLQSRNGLMSTMIAGPSNFPVARMNKKNEVIRKRLNEAVDYFNKFVNKANKKATPEELKPIQSGDPEAVTKLKNKIEKLEQFQEAMKAANKVIKAKKLTDDQKVKKLAADLKISESKAAELLKPDYAGRIGFPSYQLTNNNANISRLKKRLAQEQRNQSTETSEQTVNGVRIEQNAQDNRVRLYFDGKPEADTRTALKKLGFKWSPSNQAWQTFLSSYSWKENDVLQLINSL